MRSKLHFIFDSIWVICQAVLFLKIETVAIYHFYVIL